MSVVNALATLFGAMAKTVQLLPGQKAGTMNKVQALNAFNIVKNETPNLINLLPNDIKQKFANGLSYDLFSQIDPLGVQDGLINAPEFTAALSPKSNVNTGNGLRGDSGFNTNASGYSVNGADGKYNPTLTAQNIIGDYENLLKGTKGNIVNGNINKGELETVISTYRAAGLNDRAAVAQGLLDNYDKYKNAKGDIDVASLAAGLGNTPNVSITPQPNPARPPATPAAATPKPSATPASTPAAATPKPPSLPASTPAAATPGSTPASSPAVIPTVPATPAWNLTPKAPSDASQFNADIDAIEKANGSKPDGVIRKDEIETALKANIFSGDEKKFWQGIADNFGKYDVSHANGIYKGGDGKINALDLAFEGANLPKGSTGPATPAAATPKPAATPPATPAAATPKPSATPASTPAAATPKPPAAATPAATPKALPGGDYGQKRAKEALKEILESDGFKAAAKAGGGNTVTIGSNTWEALLKQPKDGTTFWGQKVDMGKLKHDMEILLGKNNEGAAQDAWKGLMAATGSPDNVTYDEALKWANS